MILRGKCEFVLNKFRHPTIGRLQRDGVAACGCQVVMEPWQKREHEDGLHINATDSRSLCLSSHSEGWRAQLPSNWGQLLAGHERRQADLLNRVLLDGPGHDRDLFCLCFH